MSSVSFELAQERIIDYMRTSATAQAEIIRQLLESNKALQKSVDTALTELKAMREKAASGRAAAIS
jgi:hypothetical protein